MDISGRVSLARMLAIIRERVFASTVSVIVITLEVDPGYEGETWYDSAYYMNPYL
jgi:hypothetical protein